MRNKLGSGPRWRPGADQLHFIDCPLCGGSRFCILAVNDRHDIGIRTVGCLACGLVMTNPQLTEAGLNEFYEKQYRQFYQGLAEPNAEYIAKYRKDERTAETASFLAGRGVLRDGARVLDIGAAEGCLLRACRKHAPGMIAVGVEPDSAFAAFGAKYASAEFYPSILELPDRFRGSFDLIIINHVLEHVSGPVEFLKGLHDWLSEDGVLYIDVPDIERYGRTRDLHIAHLYHFCARTLRGTLARAGYAPGQPEAHAPIKHPRSIRVIAARARAGHGPGQPEPAQSTGREGWRRVLKADRRAGYYHRNRWPAHRRLLHYVAWAMRILAHVRAHRVRLIAGSMPGGRRA